MPGEFLTPDDVAAQLGLHVRTVRSYIRDGHLKGTRIGKQYRIARSDLDAFTGRTSAPSESASAATRHVGSSAIVDADRVDRTTADRISTTLTASAGQRDQSEPALRIETIYDERRAHLKVVVVGGLADTTFVLRAISAILEEPAP